MRVVPKRMIVIREIVPLQDALTLGWHEQPELGSAPAEPVGEDEWAMEEKDHEDWLRLVERQHRANFDLWHIEDEARRPGASDTELASVKRRIDVTNQLRNDLIEQMDRSLHHWLGERGLPNAVAPLHSETPGLMIDRLSILSLKIFHTRQEVDRERAPDGHAGRNRERLAILEKQRRDLAGCLDALWNEILGGARRFELYRQMKMYNDPTLNPAIYGDADCGGKPPR